MFAIVFPGPSLTISTSALETVVTAFQGDGSAPGIAGPDISKNLLHELTFKALE
jgi:hypothetical protein